MLHKYAQGYIVREDDLAASEILLLLAKRGVNACDGDEVVMKKCGKDPNEVYSLRAGKQNYRVE